MFPLDPINLEKVMKILAFAATNNSQSINKQLVQHATSLVDAEVELLDLNDYEMPIYSQDREQANGIPQEAQRFFDKIGQADVVVISFAEHNGSYTAAYKNLFDWTSRMDKKIWSDKQVFLLATSPGGRGGKTVLGSAVSSFPHQGAAVVASFSLPSFFQNFSAEDGIKDETLAGEFAEQLEKFSNSLHK